MARPKGPDRATLIEHNVTAAPGLGDALILTCGQCGREWEVYPTGGRLAPFYWQCPHGCNHRPGRARVHAGPSGRDDPDRP